MTKRAAIGKNKHSGLVTDALITESEIRGQFMNLVGSIKRRKEMKITEEDMFIILEIIDRLNYLNNYLNEMRILIIEAREEEQNIIDFEERKAR